MFLVGYILEGIQSGFRVGFNYKDQPTKSAYTNLPTTPGNHLELLSSRMCKLKEGCWDHSQPAQYQTFRLTGLV